MENIDQHKLKNSVIMVLILILFFLIPNILLAQEEDYNVSGDFYYNSNDYNTAILFYSKGIADKNDYSFKKMADIFLKKVYPISINLSYNGETVSSIPIENTTDEYDPNNFVMMFKSMAENANELAEYLLACCYESGYGMKKNENRACEIFNKLVDSYSNPICMRKLAFLIYDSDSKRAIALVEKSVKIESSPSAYLELAMMYYKKGNYGKAKKNAQKSLDICKSKSGYYVFAGCSLKNSMSINQFDESVTYQNLADKENDLMLGICEIVYIKSIFNF